MRKDKLVNKLNKIAFAKSQNVIPEISRNYKLSSYEESVETSSGEANRRLYEMVADEDPEIDLLKQEIQREEDEGSHDENTELEQP